MMRLCDTCSTRYNDENAWTICPHQPLGSPNVERSEAPGSAYCREHDLFGCPFHEDSPSPTDRLGIADVRITSPTRDPETDREFAEIVDRGFDGERDTAPAIEGRPLSELDKEGLGAGWSDRPIDRTPYAGWHPHAHGLAADLPLYRPTWRRRLARRIIRWWHRT